MTTMILHEKLLFFIEYSVMCIMISLQLVFLMSHYLQYFTIGNSQHYQLQYSLTASKFYLCNNFSNQTYVSGVSENCDTDLILFFSEKDEALDFLEHLESCCWPIFLYLIFWGFLKLTVGIMKVHEVADPSMINPNFSNSIGGEIYFDLLSVGMCPEIFLHYGYCLESPVQRIEYYRWQYILIWPYLALGALFLIIFKLRRGYCRIIGSIGIAKFLTCLQKIIFFLLIILSCAGIVVGLLIIFTNPWASINVFYKTILLFNLIFYIIAGGLVLYVRKVRRRRIPYRIRF